MNYLFYESDVPEVKKLFDSHLTPEMLDRYCLKRDAFVETGTYLGDTVKLAKHCGFKEIHSIELDKDLYEKAVEMFKDDPTIHIWHGDSVECLPKIIERVSNDAVFWLDAHASGTLPGGKSGGSPVIDELKILGAKTFTNYVIFIDDRRLFGTDEWSNVQEQDAIGLLKAMNPWYKITYEDGHIAGDVICASTWNWKDGSRTDQKIPD